ncbi:MULTISPECIES: hypothetical protein [unclassified Rhizobium]|uniref:hypothetical protein n=1 Tax=unclassified Rhizobium TaxID=2613769 RepID=UPI000F740152|nr:MULTISPECIES: hypothetical protein [unclassified Rhizobium]
MLATALGFLENEQALQTAREDASEAAWSLITLQDRLWHVRSLVTLIEYALEGMSPGTDGQVNALQTGTSMVYEGVTSAEELLRSVRAQHRRRCCPEMRKGLADQRKCLAKPLR